MRALLNDIYFHVLIGSWRYRNVSDFESDTPTNAEQ